MGRSGDGKRNNLLGWPKVGAWERLKEYPGQHFAVVGGKLRCNACSENLSDKKSSLDKYTKSKKHETGLASIIKSLLFYFYTILF